MLYCILLVSPFHQILIFWCKATACRNFLLTRKEYSSLSLLKMEILKHLSLCRVQGQNLFLPFYLFSPLHSLSIYLISKKWINLSIPYYEIFFLIFLSNSYMLNTFFFKQTPSEDNGLFSRQFSPILLSIMSPISVSRTFWRLYIKTLQCHKGSIQTLSGVKIGSCYKEESLEGKKVVYVKI